MKNIDIPFSVKFALVLLVTISVWGCGNSGTEPDLNEKNLDVELWLSDPGQNIKFEKQSDRVSNRPDADAPTIIVDANTSFQEIDGFGFALTGGSARHLINMTNAARQAILTELFGADAENIGTSYLRVSIGASDLSRRVYSYNDLPAGRTDIDMSEFSLDPDREHVIPVLREILQINPDLKIMGSPWSAPAWMKTNNSSVGGSLRRQFYDAYAKYFVKYIQGMAQEGIPIDAITVQNEPLHGGNNPSMVMQAEEQAEFVKNYLGPALQAAGLETKIIIYDHNADRPDYPISILNDPQAKQYIDGSAFHLYAGDINALSQVHEAHPDKNLYFTEQWIGAPGNFAGDMRWHVRNLIIGATRNGCRTVIEWNLAADENQDPHTPGGCDQCLGALTISGDRVTRNPAYYIIAHAAKFVRPGSRRVESSVPEGLLNAAFQTPDDTLVLIVLNDTNAHRNFNIEHKNDKVSTELAAGGVGTFVFQQK